MTQDPAMLAGVQLVTLRRIEMPAGAVMHGLKASEDAFKGFGEAYFTSILEGHVKAWKRHGRMVSNLIVPAGRIRLRMMDDRADSPTRGAMAEAILGEGDYRRLTLPPGVWFGFQGLAAGTSLMLNLASIEHDPDESDVLPPDDERFGPGGW